MRLSTAPIRGFSSKGSAAERAVERRFRERLSAESIRSWHRYFTSEPHPATSPRTREIADYIAAQWKAQGLEDVVIHRYDVLSSNPRRVRAELVAPIRYVPTLREDPIKEDPDSFQRGISGAWVSFSASGDVTAPVVYANSGNPADYDVLRKNGIDPKGKIVVVRYSNPYSYRGFKALTARARRRGGDDRLFGSARGRLRKGDVVPKGPWGPASHIQRGGIAYDYIVPGDPLTPGWASTAGARRIPIGEAVSVPKIMALADVASRHAADPREARRTAGAARVEGRSADRVSTWRRGRPPSSADRHAHRRAAELRRRGTDSRQRAARRMGRARQPSRCLGVRRRRSVERHGVDDGAHQVVGQTQAGGHAAEPNAGVLQLGRRRGDADRIDRVGRAVSLGAAGQGRRLSERGFVRLGSATRSVSGRDRWRR